MNRSETRAALVNRVRNAVVVIFLLTVSRVEGWAIWRFSASRSHLGFSRQSAHTKSRKTVLYGSLSHLDDDSLRAMGLNELQTLLRKAVKGEKYKEAARLRDVIAERLSPSSSSSQGTVELNGSKPKVDERKLMRLSWVGLGTAPWLVDRLEALSYNIPTTVQVNSFESINAMLLSQKNNADSSSSSSQPNQDATTLEELFESSQTQPYMPTSTQNQSNSYAVIISGSTGSGKTLAYGVPMLSTLSEALFRRQRVRTKAEEDVDDVARDLLSRVSIATSPEVRGRPGRKQVGGGSSRDDSESEQINQDPPQGAVASVGKGSGYDVTHPLALVVVPTRELGVQTAMNIYELVGGSTKKTPTEFSGLANMFKYKGPKGVKIGCILDPVEAETGLKLQTDIAITTPKYLTRLIDEGDVDPEKLRVVVFDEADLALELTKADDLHRLFDLENKEDEDAEDVINEPWLRHKSRLTFMVGASVTEALMDSSGQKVSENVNILPEGRTYLATATSFAPVTFDNSSVISANPTERIGGASTFGASLGQLRVQLDPGLIHERVVAPDDSGLLCLCRMLRRELKEYSAGASSALSATSGTNSAEDDDPQVRPRVVVFFPSEGDASQSMSKLRDAMWGDHKLGVLLPNTGVAPLSVMDDFKSNRTSVLLATPNSVRGLDFEGLTHVYTLYLPTRDPREYVHLAGRVGRMGQVGSVSGSGGRVTSILREEDAGQMEELANKLNFQFIDVEFAAADFEWDAIKEDEDGEGMSIDEDNFNVDDMRRYLEDKITLLAADDDTEDGDINPKTSGCDI